MADHEAGRKKLPDASGLATVQPGALAAAGTLLCLVYVCVFCMKKESLYLYMYASNVHIKDDLIGAAPGSTGAAGGLERYSAS